MNTLRTILGKLMLGLVSLALLGGGTTAHAVPATVGINFYADNPSTSPMGPADTAGVIPTANWNNVNFATVAVANLLDATGSPTAISLALTAGFAPGTFNNGGSVVGDKKMMTGFLYVGINTSFDVGFSGLDTSWTGDAGYDVYVYCAAGSIYTTRLALLDAGNTVVAGPVTLGDVAPIGFSGTTYVESDGAGSPGHYYKFSNVHLATFSVRVSTPNNFGFVNGIQIVKATAPVSDSSVQSIAPTGQYVPTNAVVTVKLKDGIATAVDTNSILLFLNGSAVSPVVNKPAGTNVTTVTYAPPGGFVHGSSNTVEIVFSDNSAPPIFITNDFSFEVITLADDTNTVHGTVGINFNAIDASTTMAPADTAGVLPSANWNNIPVATLSRLSLLDEAGRPTSVNLAISSPGFSSSVIGNSAPAGGDKKMMTGHIAIGVGGKIDVGISGLDAGYTNGFGYDVYVYYRAGSVYTSMFSLLDAGNAVVAGPVAVGDSGPIGFNGTYVESDGAGSPGHYYKFSNLHLTDFTVEVTTLVNFGFVSGMQILHSRPFITSTQSGANLMLSWLGGGTLQSSTNVFGTYVDIPGANSPVTVPTDAPQMYYRVRQ